MKLTPGLQEKKDVNQKTLLIIIVNWIILIPKISRQVKTILMKCAGLYKIWVCIEGFG